MAEGMPEGYAFVPQPNDVAQRRALQVAPGRCSRSPATSSSSRRCTTAQSIEPDADLSALCKDVFLLPLEGGVAARDPRRAGVAARGRAARRAQERDRAVDDLIDLVGAVDGILQAQAAADARYFAHVCGRSLSRPSATQASTRRVLKAYRWQYIVSGAAAITLQQRADGLDHARAAGADRQRAGTDHADVRRALSTKYLHRAARFGSGCRQRPAHRGPHAFADRCPGNRLAVTVE